MTKERWFLIAHTLFNVILLIVLIVMLIYATKLYREAEELNKHVERLQRGSYNYERLYY